MKNIKYIVVGLISFISLMGVVKAAPSISIKTSSNSVVQGTSVTISATINSDSPLANIEGTMACSGAGVSKSIKLDFDDMSNKLYSKSYYLGITPNMAGVVTCNITNAKATIMTSAGWHYLSTTPLKINVINKPTNNPGGGSTNQGNGNVTPKSSVNYLKSLEIEGKQLTPKFDKENSEYTIELEQNTTEINIKATLEDEKASVIGTGTIKVSEGVNNLSIVVTAENGSKRTYKIKATVKEKNPIIVKINDEDYTIIRKKEQLIPASAFYSEKMIKINDEEIPAYYGEITGYTLVGLKNSEGKIELFIYNEKDKSYKVYREFNFSKITFYPFEPDKNIIPADYKKFKIKINDIEIDCYKQNEKDDFVLLYGINIENNNKGFYIYDPYEHTLQRYNNKIFDLANNKIKFLTNALIGFFAITLIILITSAIQGTKNRKKKKKPIVSDEEIMKQKMDKIEAKNLKKELMKKEKKPKVKKAKNFLDDTHIIDVNEINMKK